MTATGFRPGEASGGDASRGLRVLIVDPWFFTPFYDQDLAEALADAGHEVTLVGSSGGDADVDLARLEDGATAGRSVRVERPFRAPPRWMPRPVALAVKGLLHAVGVAGLVRHTARTRPDVVHLQWFPLPLLDAVALFLLRRMVPVVATVHDSKPYNGAGPWLLRAGVALIHRQLDHLVVHNDVSIRNLVDEGIASQRLHKIPLGMAAPALLAASNVDEGPASNRSSTGDGTLRLLQFGKIKHYKGVDVLLDALARLDPERRRRCRLDIVGRPYIDTDPLVDAVRSNDLGDVVEFRFDFVDDDTMEDYFRTADLAVFPYRSIDTSAVLFQVIGWSLPVLASSVGCFEEVLTDHDHGLLVPPGDPVALADALAWLVDHPEEVERFRAAMGKLAEELPTWADSADMTVEVYERARKDHDAGSG